MESTKIRVLVVEDHAQTRAGIRDYLLDQGMDVSEASNTADALQLVEECRIRPGSNGKAGAKRTPTLAGVESH